MPSPCLTGCVVADAHHLLAAAEHAARHQTSLARAAIQLGVRLLVTPLVSGDRDEPPLELRRLWALHIPGQA